MYMILNFLPVSADLYNLRILRAEVTKVLGNDKIYIYSNSGTVPTGGKYADLDFSGIYTDCFSVLDL